MTKIPLERIIGNVGDRYPVDTLADLLKDAMQRLRNETGLHGLLKLSVDASTLYESPSKG
jgi:hypothetical protein